MARNYYSLVAGLREYSLDAENKGFDAREIIDDISAELSGKDRSYLELFYNYYDIQNIISMLAGRDRFDTLGTFPREELEQEIKSPVNLPRYIAEVLAAYRDAEDTDYEDVDTSKAIEKSLFEAYYGKCRNSGCRFLRDWAEFDRNLRNLTAAYTARRKGIPAREVLVGEGYVADTIARSSAADFGLKGELEYIDQVINAVSDDSNLLDKEHRIDLIRWNMADELTTFDYFDINAVLAYLVKVNLVQRWVALDPAYGRDMFARLMESLGRYEDVDTGR